MKHITLFDTTTLYNNATLDLPNVSLTLDDMEVHYNPIIDYSKLYLTFEALQDGIFTFTSGSTSMNEILNESISYSLDEGTTWLSLASGTASPTITAGNKIMWKGNLISYPLEEVGIGCFTSTGNYNVEGNIMSLINGDNFINLSLISCAFRMLFGTYGTNTKLINAKNLVLPTTTSNSCYASMFSNCTNLLTAPELPATELETCCYMGMFSGCTSLTTAPVLLSAIFSSSTWGYFESMFSGCINLNHITCLVESYNIMNFSGWVSNVASTGTFVKSVDMTDFPIGEDGIPNGWVVENIGIPGRLVAKYNVTDTSSSTKLLYDSSNISAIEIDGTTLDNVVDTYTFSTTGKHIVKYNLTDNTDINESTFKNCSSLTNVTIPNSVTSIGNSAFIGCSSLTSVDIPNSVTSIGSYAFSNCPNLINIYVDSGNSKYDSRNNCNAIIETATNTLIAGCKNTIIPNSVFSIGKSAFGGCSSLTSMNIPSSVVGIGDGAFMGCSSLTTLTVQGTTPPVLGTHTLRFTNGNLVIKVPSASVNAYKSASGWSDYASKIQAIS